MSARFRRRSALAVHDHHVGPNMTPMVDVVMVILIFFMASASIVGPQWLLTSALPNRKAAPPAPGEVTRIEVRLSRSAGRTLASINNQPPGNPADVPATLAQAAGQDPTKLVVIVKPEGDVPYEDVVRVHEACQRLGIAKVGVANR